MCRPDKVTGVRAVFSGWRHQGGVEGTVAAGEVDSEVWRVL